MIDALGLPDAWLDQGPAVGLLTMVFAMLMWGLLVPRRTYREKCDEVKFLRAALGEALAANEVSVQNAKFSAHVMGSLPTPHGAGSPGTGTETP